MPAEKQAKIYNKYVDRQAERAEYRNEARSESRVESRAQATRDRVEVGAAARAHAQTRVQAQAPVATRGPGATAAEPGKPVTARRYIDIEDEGQSQRNRAPQAPAPGAAQYAGASIGNGMSLDEEVKYLKRMVEELKSAQDQSAGGSGADALLASGALAVPALQDAFEQLVLNGIDRRYAFGIIKKAGFELGAEESKSPDRVTDQVAAELMETTEVLSPLSGITAQNGASLEERTGPAVIALVGPTGVGKTTTAAKIASEALLKRNLKVGFINLDSYKVAAFDQLGTYAKILNVPFRSVASAEDLSAAMMDFHALDLVIIDTTGRSQRDPEALQDMLSILQTIPGMRSQLVLSVTTRDAELYDMATRFSMFRPQGIIVSKLDEATIFGAIYNVSQRMKLPLLYFTTGQRVPEDIEEATQERVAALILDL